MIMERDEKQAIEEMAKDLCIPTMRYLPWVNCEMCESNGTDIELCLFHKYATILTKAGYRKQVEGEWVETDYKTVEHGFVERRGKAWLCTNCRHASKEFHPNMKFCPNCGAKMKGGAE